MKIDYDLKIMDFSSRKNRISTSYAHVATITDNSAHEQVKPVISTLSLKPDLRSIIIDS